MLLGATCAPLDHCFILRIFIKKFNVSQKNIKNLEKFFQYYYVKVYIKKIHKYIIKKNSNCVFNVKFFLKLLLCNFKVVVIRG
jgi:hypothetical protein